VAPPRDAHGSTPKGAFVTSVDLAAIFEAAGVDGYFHALDLDTGNAIGHQDEQRVIPASVFKLPVLLELFRQHEAGEIDVTALVEVPSQNRTPGPYGMSVMLDPITVSLRDLAWLMIGISDNAATDVVCDRVSLEKVNANLAALGIRQTVIAEDVRILFAGVIADLGVTSLAEVTGPITPELYALVSALDPQRAATYTTPRDMTSLLRMIWQDDGPPAAAAAEVRRILGLQVWPHRLAAGFADLDEVKTSGKTGTLPAIRNEVGVVEYPDGGRYAVACFTRSTRLTQKDAAADAVIGRSARLAVDALRGET
jgi:beta-lactamase class A